MKYSIIIPVYNRPEETAELLDSLSKLSPVGDCSLSEIAKDGRIVDFEVIVVEDGSSISSESVVSSYANVLNLKYLVKPNGGPGPARNYGAAQAQGKWLLFLDSDTIVPCGWLQAIDRYLTEAGVFGAAGVSGSLSAASDSSAASASALPSTIVEKTSILAAFGGPDRSSADFSPLQKAISYSMTSLFTTGGIRGGKQRITKFFPRSFNMGIRADVFREMKGFAAMRFGEDVDLSMRIVEAGYRTALIDDAWLFHKRRTDLSKFFRQVLNSGRARIALSRRHPGSLKIVHLFPLAFVIASALIWPFDLFYATLILIDSTLIQINEENQEFAPAFAIGLMSVAAAYVQLWGYGLGFVQALFSSDPICENVDNDKFYE